MKRSTLFIFLLFAASNVHAYSLQQFWQDLWYTRDQQGARALKTNQPAMAANYFKDPNWKGVAEYRSKNFLAAADSFKKNDTAINNFNQGNSLAQVGKFDEAIAIYERTLKQNPNFTDAKYNLELLKKLKKQNSSKSEEDKRQNKQQDKSSNNKDEQNKKSDAQDSSKSKEKSKQNDNQSAHEQEEDKNQTTKNEKNNPSENKTDKEASKQRDDIHKSVNDKAEALTKKLMQSFNKQQNQKPSEAKTTPSPQQDKQSSPQDLQQGLQQIPEEPSGLLQQKFLRDHQRRIGDY